MEFNTKIPIPKSNFPIDYNSKIVSFGSCFAENIAQKFDYFKFQNLVNPFGIIFNAVAIERIVERIVNLEYFTENDIFYHNELWHCFEIHSELSHPNKNIFLNNLNQIISLTHSQIIALTHCIITYGTSWVYRNIENNQVVANCHKTPQKHFTKELLAIEATQKSIENTISLIHSINKEVKFIFTVSPVRHIKDGFVENNVSKSHIIAALHKILNFESKFVNYFASYEIILDELRDYRFFKPDMLHPNEIAVDYVWQKFVESTISGDSYLIMNEVENIQKMIHHKSINHNSIQNQQFKIKLQTKIADFMARNPQIIF